MTDTEVTFKGVPVYSSPHMPLTENRQFRFPRSKKKRIRKKWAKNPANYRESDVIWMISGGYHCHPRVYARLLALSL